MKVAGLLAALVGIGLVFAVGFGYGRWYSTKPDSVKSARRVLYYKDPMHPWYHANKPGVAPDCGMKLEPVFEDSFPLPASGPAPAQPSSPNAIRITSEQQQLIGLRYGQAEWTSAGEPVRANGRVTVDETRVMRVQARTEGWIDKVSADFLGKSVEKGQQLLTLYSPELLAAQKELLLAMKASAAMQHSSMSDSMANSEALVEAARHRLQLLNLSDAEIEAVERGQKPVQYIPLYAPESGAIVSRNAFPGQHVTADTDLYTLADLTHVWVMADVFEPDAPRIHIGQSAQVTLQGTGASFTAKVSFLQPQIDPTTRTLKIRLELDNPGMRLRPDMFVEVDFSAGAERRLTVPAEAVLDAGATKTVFLDRGNGFFEPREVETGERSGERVEVRKGLAAGDRIVTSGVFLLNSERQIRQGSEGSPAMPDMPEMAGAPAAKSAGSK